LTDKHKYDQLLKAFKRERSSRKEAERIIEEKALELYYANNQLLEINKNLELIIADRTKDIEKSKEDLELAKKIAEDATKAKSEFLSNMTHELRTPLNGVIGLSELVLNENLDDSVREMLENIKFSAEHLGNVINEILDFSKIEAGRITFEKIQFNFQELISNTHKNLELSAKNKNVDFILEYDNSIPSVLLGDPVKLNQILNNLIGNAIKFTDKGYVKLICKLKYIKNKDQEVIIRFEIEDTGIGIKEENLENIFTSFMQSDSAISRKYGGTGLGLTITKSFIELQNGFLDVKSKYGFGSVFFFEMPFKYELQKEILEPKSNPFENKKINAKVLVVDDVLINQLVVSKMLNKWGAQVDLASNGKEAVFLIKNNIYDIVLMDIQMPEMSGIEATRIIRSSNEKDGVSNIPIIAFTASAFEKSQKEVLDSGMNSFITKPVQPEKLFREIYKLIPDKTHHDYVR